ncbi:hypothetical protein ACJRPK_05225 [Aquimarina sp. 2-A2]|uniref:hypothetical protein n=1 Tax=Aquimarina sp. 2-A2 TaxID=3382644 RepID=UPI00387F363F
MSRVLIYVCLLLSLPCWSQKGETANSTLESLTNFTNIRDFTVSTSGLEGYCTIQSPLGEVSYIVRVQKTDASGWSNPQLVRFSGQFMDLEPFLSGDGLKLYFASNRPLDSIKSKSKDFDIWYVQRDDLASSWSDPINLGTPVNTKADEFYPSIVADGSIYFTSTRTGTKGKDDIFYSQLQEGEFKAPISLEKINTEGYEFNAYVSPKEDFMIFTAYQRKDGMGSGDLYISYRDKNKKWGSSINLGNEINSLAMDYCPYYDFRTHTLYFTSRRSVIENDKKYKSLEAIEKAINVYSNGYSRVYDINFDPENYIKI